jgi:hypothetical protein
METHAKKQKVDDEAQERLDPLQNAIQEHLLQELMFQHFTGNEVKQLFEVSKLWNEIASQSKKCGEKLKLKITIEEKDDAEKLASIKRKRRKHSSLSLQSSKPYQELPETFPFDLIAAIGLNIKELKVLCPMKFLVKILSLLRNLESLTVRGKITGNAAQPLQLPKLKELKGNIIQPQILQLLRDVNTLETFDYRSIVEENSDIKLLEDFILRQEKLKNFMVGFCSNGAQRSLFEDINRLNEMKFQLETIGITASSIHPNSAVEFFRRQQSLKTVELIHGLTFPETPEEMLQSIRTVLTLPKLDTLKLSGFDDYDFDFHDFEDHDFEDHDFEDHDFEDHQNIRNTSVKFVEIKSDEGETIMNEVLFEMFPNLQQISITSKNTVLRLFVTRCERLSLIQFPNLSKFVYQPPLINFDRVFFESKLEEFLVKSQNIRSVAIGHRNWIEMNDMKLSLEFWKKILCQRPKLARFKIFHSGNVIDLVNLFKNDQRNFAFVTIYTNKIGEISAEDIELPEWMTVSMTY